MYDKLFIVAVFTLFSNIRGQKKGILGSPNSFWPLKKCISVDI